MSESKSIEEIKPNQITLPFWRQLGTYLTLGYLLLGILPVLIVTYVILLRMRDQATSQVYDQLNSVVELKSDQILRWLDEGNLAIDTLLSSSNSKQFSDFAAAELVDLREQADLNNKLVDIVKTQYFNRLFIYDTAGRVIAASDPADIGRDVSDQPYFKVSLHANYIQAPFVESGGTQLIMYVTRPLRGEKIQASGVLAGELNIDSLADIMTERTGLGVSGETYLVSLQNHHFLSPSLFEGYQLTSVYHSEGIDRALNGEKGYDAYVDYRNPPVPVFGSYRFIPELQAALLAEIDQSEALATFRQVRLVSIGVAVLAMLVALSVGLYAGQAISRPIHGLTLSAQRIGAGELKTEVVGLQRPDEIGLLAHAFHQMQSELATSYEKLEQRVADRTKALATSAQVSRRLSTILNERQLIVEVVEQIRAAFDYYHVHIYLLDEASGDLVMAGGTGDAGASLLASGHKIPKGKGLVGRSAGTNLPVLVGDTSRDPDWLPNPLLPETKSEAAVPIAAGDKVLGVLDVQDNKTGRLNQEDIDLLQSIATQVAIALRNARSYAEAQQRADREARITTIGQKIQSTTTVEAALQVTARELSRSLGMNNIRVILDAASLGENRRKPN